MFDSVQNFILFFQFFQFLITMFWYLLFCFLYIIFIVSGIILHFYYYIIILSYIVTNELTWAWLILLLLYPLCWYMLKEKLYCSLQQNRISCSFFSRGSICFSLEQNTRHYYYYIYIYIYIYDFDFWFLM